MKISHIVSMTAAVLVASCAVPVRMPAAEDGPSPESVAPHAMPVEATSFLGEPLMRRGASEEKEARALQALEKLDGGAILSEEELLELGADIAAAGRYQDAITAYSKGIELHPGSYQLRRHRAHRFITTRQLEKARHDLENASELISAQAAEEVLEFKGGEPHGTYSHWVNYHLGIYHYLNQDFDAAAREFESCVETAADNDMLIGSVDWLYNAHLRNGDIEKAQAALELISGSIQADESYPYYKRVMIYKGTLSAEEVVDLDKSDTWSGRDATVAYGLASGMIASGKTDAAKEVLEDVLQTPYWPIWAYVTAESDYAALTGGAYQQ